MQRRGAPGGDGADHDDPAGAARRHAAAGSEAGNIDAAKVDRDDAVEIVERQVLQLAAALDQSGIGHQRLDRPEPPLDVLERGLGRVLVHDVERDCFGFYVARRRDAACGVDVADDDAPAALHQHLRRGKADAAGATGHQRDTAAPFVPCHDIPVSMGVPFRPRDSVA